MIKMGETSLEDLSVRAVITEAKSLVDREIHSVPFFLLFGLVIGFVGWMAELQQSQKISDLHNMLFSPNLIGEPIMLLYLAILAHAFFVALFGRCAAKYGIAPIHSFWSALVSISSVLLGWMIFAYFAPWKVSQNVEIMALKAGALVILFGAGVLIVLALLKAFYELRVSHLSRRQMFSIKNMWQFSLIFGAVFFVLFMLSLLKQLIG